MRNEWFTCANPFEMGQPVKVSTKAEIVDWLNTLARHIGVAKSALNPNGYLATEGNVG